MNSATQSDAVTGWEPAEMAEMLQRPHRAFDLLLSRPDRLALTIGGGRGLPALVLLLLATGLLAALPFGLLCPGVRFYTTALLYTGSLLICLPSLHVFSVYLGFPVSPLKSAAVGLVISATAGAFTFGFAPIIWFMDVTAPAAGVRRGVTVDLAIGLLAVALAMGLHQLGRCLFGRSGLSRAGAGYSALVLVWLALFLFITWRMALLLGIVTP